jgi:hypothetical protein
MTRVWLVGTSLVWLATALIRAQSPAQPTPAGDAAPIASSQGVGRIDYASQIQPILEEFCADCHDGETRKGGLSLATYADMLEGGRSGASIRPGASARSLLMERLTGAVEPQMPKDEDALDAARLALIRAWIDEGARATPTSPPAPQPWDAPLTLTSPTLPAAVWPTWSRPVDRIVAAYLTSPPERQRHSVAQAVVATAAAPASRAEPGVVTDAVFMRRASLDIWGLLPDPGALHAFVADRATDKRERLVKALLADRERYAEHWMSFWNDLLRNEDGVNYFSEGGGRKSITPWLLDALRRNRPYDEFVSALLNPSAKGDPEGFLIGVNWRGETSAAVTPWMQASQNTAQVFLGVNMKCNACHDSFVNRWKLKDAYGLAAFFSPEPRLRLYRCDVARDEYTGPQFPFPELVSAPRSETLGDRRAAAARLFTDPGNGRLPRTLVNRIWERLLGHGIVANSDEMDTRPWSPELLDWLAADFVAHDYDVQHLIATIMTSRSYQMAAVPRAVEPSAKDYVFAGPELRRLTAEQFGDAVGSLTGEWSTWPGPSAPRRTPAGSSPTAMRVDSDPRSVGVYGREWRVASTTLTRALGRPVRDQVISVRPDDATTPQALELVNGERLTQWLSRGARRLTGDLAPETYSRFTAAIAGRTPKARGFDLDVSSAASLWLVVQDTGSNVPERVQPVWVDAVLVDADGVETRLTSLTPDGGALERTDASAKPAQPRLYRAALGQPASPARPAGTETPVTAEPAASSGHAASPDLLPVKAPSVLRYDLGKRFVRFRGMVDVANPRSEIGATLNPSVRFFIFDAAPDLQRPLPPGGAAPLPAPPAATDARELVDRIFWHALGRAPADAERSLAERVVTDPTRPDRLSPTGVADLLWAVLMKPEFQLIY